MAFNNIYLDKKVLVTGNTGFKGSWLTTWLHELGAKVFGIAKDIPTSPSMFKTLDLKKQITHYKLDVRNYHELSKTVKEIQPDFVFHLAAQAIVSLSYSDPIETISTNVLGTANLLESLRHNSLPCTAIIITSDKAYDNIEWIWGYRENDLLGGKDIYSGSKGATELIIKSYFNSFIRDSEDLKIGVGRAGNVIGGGDWSPDRIVVDCIRAWSKNETVILRSPNSTRPWQHVLEPLSGYLALGQALNEKKDLNGEAFNFGPRNEINQTVLELASELARIWGFKEIKNAIKVTDNIPFHEANLLKLNCDKAMANFRWRATLDNNTMISLIADWYKKFYHGSTDMRKLTVEQINTYEKEAKKQSIPWSC